MLTDDDKGLICKLVDMRYTAIRKAHELEARAKELQVEAKIVRESVKHITLKKIADKFETNESTVMREALSAGIDLSRPKRTW